jgi:hypothetical protein
MMMIVEARIHNPDFMGFFIALTNWLKSYRRRKYGRQAHSGLPRR